MKSGSSHQPAAGTDDDSDGATAEPAAHEPDDADAQHGGDDRQPEADVEPDPEPADPPQHEDDPSSVESDPQPGTSLDGTGGGEPGGTQILPTEPETEPASTQALRAADVTVEDEKSAWDWLPEYPDIQGVTKTEVAAVVFVAATAATVVSIPTAPLLTIPLLLVTMAAWARFEDLGTNHHAPTASAGSPTRLLGVVSGGLSGADEDGDPVTFTVESGPANGSVQIVGNELLGYRYIYTADNPFTVGAINDSFTVKFDDFGGWRNHPLGMHSELLTITVSDPGLANVGPVVLPVSVGLPDRAGVVRGGVLATDPEGGPLAYRLGNGQQSVVTSKGGIVHLDGENYIYIPPTSGGGLLNVILDSFDITISDADDATATVTVGIATTELDFDFTGVFDESANTVTGEIDAPADDVALFTYALGAGPGRGAVSVDPVSGSYVYTATGTAEDDSFTVVGTDAFGNQLTFAVAVAPAGVNHGPVVVPVGVGIPDIVSGVVTGGVLGTDVDNDPLHYSAEGYGGGQAVVLGNGAMVLVDSDGKWTYIPPRDGGGLLGIVDDSFTIYVTDGRGGQASTVIGILTHDLKIGVDNTVSNGTVTGGLNLPAALIGKLTYALGGQTPAKGDVTVDPAGTFTYVATTAVPGEIDTFSIVATAHGKSIVIAEVSVTAIPANRAPEADLLGGGVGTGVLTGKINAGDADGDTLAWHVGGVGAGNSVLRPNGSIFQIDASGNWKYIPTTDGGLLGEVGDSFTVYVSDGKGGVDSTIVTIVTTELAIDYNNTASEGSVTGGLSIPSSLSGVFAGYSLGAGAPAGVTVNPDGTYEYTGASQAAFSIVGTNLYGTSMTVANVTVTPVAPNRAPTLDTKGLNITPLPGKTETWTGVTVWDADGDSVTWSASASNGTVSFSTALDVADLVRGGKISSRTVTYRSSGGSDGSVLPPKVPSNGPGDVITVTVTDASGKSLSFTLSYPA